MHITERDTQDFYVKSQIGRKPWGGEKSTIIHWLYDFQKWNVKSLNAGLFLEEGKENLIPSRWRRSTYS